jgi:hypothetical protein
MDRRDPADAQMAFSQLFCASALESLAWMTARDSLPVVTFVPPNLVIRRGVA